MRLSGQPRFMGVLVGLCLLFELGCATATVRKVLPTNRDTLTGVRFYMPRPYVNIYKTFPVEAEAFLMDGIVAPDGKSIRLDSDLPTEAAALIEYGRAGSLPAAIVFSSPGRKVPGAQGTVGDEGAQGEGEGQSEEEPPSEEPGTSSFDVKRDLNAVGHFPLRDYFDLVYLPDFEEQYVVEPKGRLGKAKVQLTLGPGNTMIALGTQVDNSALVGPLVAAYEDLLKTGTAAVKTALGLPPLPGVTTPEAQGSVEGQIEAGTAVTLRFHVVRYAVPGVYPLLKPTELAQWTTTYPPADGHRLVGGFVFRTFESLIVEHLTQPETLAASIGKTPERPAGGTAKLKAADESDLKRILDIRLRNANLEVASVVAVDPSDYSAPLNSVHVKIRPVGGATVSEAKRETAIGQIKRLHPSTQFTFDVS